MDKRYSHLGKWCGFLVLLSLLLGACGGTKLSEATFTQVVRTTPTPTAVEPEQPKMGGTLIFGMKQDITTLDPLQAIQYGDIRLNSLVVQQLVAPDRTGKFVGVLAENWSTSEDGKIWIFHLRQGVRFHNGQVLKANDVKWIFDRILDDQSGAALHSTFVNIGLQVDVVDDATVKMTITSGIGPFLSYLALLNRPAIIHRDSYGPDGKITRLIGTGPFLLDSYEPGAAYTLVKNPDYWVPGQPYLDRVILKVIPDANDRLVALRNGQVDMTEELPSSDVKSLLVNQDPNFTTSVYYINSGERLVMNQKRPPFDNVNARLAVEYALDRNQYNEDVFLGLGQVHNQPFTPDNVWFLDVPIIQPDLARAKTYFQEAGLAPGTPITFMAMDNQEAQTKFIKTMLEAIGFTVRIDPVDTTEWNRRGHAYDYDLLLGTMTGIFDPDRPYGYLSAKNSNNWLVGGYDSPEMNDLLGRGIAIADVTRRRAIYTQILEKIQREAITLYVLGLPWVEAWHNDVVGYRPGISPTLMMMDASDGLNVTWLDRVSSP